MTAQRIETIDDYFSTINPIARKIHLDINETKSSYEHIWHELNANEQTDIINETLIKPEIALRYFDTLSSSSSSSASSTPSSVYNAQTDDDRDLQQLITDKIQNGIYLYDGKNLRTFTNQKTAQKLIHDDIIGVFRDEHSAPFSFKTKSQINLNLVPSNTQTPIGQKSHQPGAVLATAAAAGTLPAPPPANGLNNSTTTNKSATTARLNRSSDVPTKITGGGGCESPAATATIVNKQPNSILLPALVKNKMANTTTSSKKYERFYDDEKLLMASLKSSTVVGADRDDRTPTISEPTNDHTNEKINFLTKFICKNNLIFNTTTTTAASSTNSQQSGAAAAADCDDGTITCAVDDDEKRVLMKSFGGCGSGGGYNKDNGTGDMTSSSSLQSEDDDDKHIDEDSKLLLDVSADDLRKGFDFLNNW